MQKVTLILALLLASACEADKSVSDIKPDEHVVFFRTAAWFEPDTELWHVPIHGWIYEPEDSSSRKAIFETILDESFGLQVTPGNDAIFAERINLLIADNERGKEIVINLAGKNYVLPESSENGHFSAILQLSADKVGSEARNGLLHYTAVTADSDDRQFAGTVRLVEPTGMGVISDIDDTVKVSNVLDKRSLLEHTFLLDFSAAPGMADLYRRWSNNDVSFHFVSSSPWQLYTPLQEFLDDEGFPWATFNLKAVRFRDETLLDLFKKGTETKPAIVEQILATYPGRRFVLVGDSGEQDPEVYADVMRRFPSQVDKIYIRNVSGDTPANERFTRVFEGIDADRWTLFDDPQTLELPEYP